MHRHSSATSEDCLGNLCCLKHDYVRYIFIQQKCIILIWTLSLHFKDFDSREDSQNCKELPRPRDQSKPQPRDLRKRTEFNV